MRAKWLGKPKKLITVSVALFIIFDSLLLLAFAGLTGESSSRILENEVANYVERIMDQTTIILDNQMTDVRARMIRLTSDTAVQRCLNAENPTYSYTLPYERTISTALREISLFKPYIEDILIIGNNGFVYNRSNRSDLLTGYDYQSQDWYKKAILPDNNVYIRMIGLHKQDFYNPRVARSAAGQYTFSISMIITNTRREPTGVVMCNFNLEAIGSQLMSSNYEESGRIALVDEQGVIVGQNGNTGIGEALALSDETRKAVSSQDEGSLIGQIGAKEYLISFSTSEVSRWKLVSYIPLSEIHEHSRPIYLSMLPFLLLLLIINALIARLISSSIDRPVKKLVDEVSSIGETLKERISTDYSYVELIQISEKFNDLLSRLRGMIERDYLSQLKLERARMSAMQAQIRPHFLFNTLQLLQTEILYGNLKDADDIIVSLSRLLRYSMDSTRTNVSLDQEMAYIRDYLSLFARKYAGKLEVRFDLDQEVQKCMIPRLLLQPLVENCLKHAFLDNPKSSVIGISAMRDQSRLKIQITDNGRGMSEGRLSEVMRRLTGEGETASGVGLSNVFVRLKIACKGDCAMHIHSDRHKGTVVSIDMPLGLEEGS